ncbi:2,4-dienoyl-CoA reductase-like NADH-dependent reductase (Old Yellow Enzyme family) [Paenibacillus polymyxa]|uniref:oxidoreductase n=1 Tax=Paenibacillus polymyxa TaxID=1406 RepID=UPI00278DCC23|nr:hypothetical protein [Paenibacillus polymyxa]MDQ0046880.1 2,4-dienoyl-CoA reductase-like NADH-dependent reductase (Old Yellow Enzyme family) [Paenibacillus polymyxa]
MSDEHISPLQKVVHAIHDQGSKIGLQLWHVGRKGSLPQENSCICLWVASPQTGGPRTVHRRNQRNDAYGGSEERRYQFIWEIIDAIRTVWNSSLLVRISADEHSPFGNGSQ